MSRGGKDDRGKAVPQENKYKDVIGSITTMGKHIDKEAADILTKIASHVRPIMKKRSWFVPTLKEFYPSNPSLMGLNMNHGQQILVRLRRPGDEQSFFDFEYCLGTMLHELCHIVRGPHDAQFYKLLDELNKEYDDLLAKGFRGDGFDAPGKRVGEGISHDLHPHIAREKAVEAAHKRLKFTGWIGTAQSGQKLGGSGDLKSMERILNPGQLAAMAAEKRAARDRIWCGSDEANGTVGAETGGPEASKSAAEDTGQPSASSSSVALPVFDDSRQVRTGTPQGSAQQPKKKPSTEVICLDSDEEDTDSVSVVRHAPPAKRTKADTSSWSCPACTLKNPNTRDRCDACDTTRAGAAKEKSLLATGWYCPSCMAHNADDRFRMCSSCQFLRPV